MPPAAHEGDVPREAHVPRGNLSMPAAECQSIEGAPRRRAAPGNQLVKVAAAAATGRQAKCCASAGIEGTVPGRASEAPRHVRVPLPKVSHQPRPCAEAQRLRLSCANAGVGASAHARHASAIRTAARPRSLRWWLSSATVMCVANTLRCSSRHLTPPSSGRPKGRFAPFGPPLMSNVRPHNTLRWIRRRIELRRRPLRALSSLCLAQEPQGLASRRCRKASSSIYFRVSKQEQI